MDKKPLDADQMRVMMEMDITAPSFLENTTSIMGRKIELSPMENSLLITLSTICEVNGVYGRSISTIIMNGKNEMMVNNVTSPEKAEIQSLADLTVIILITPYKLLINLIKHTVPKRVLSEKTIVCRTNRT